MSLTVYVYQLSFEEENLVEKGLYLISKCGPFIQDKTGQEYQVKCYT